MNIHDLTNAALRGDVRTVRKALANGVDPNATDYEGFSPLGSAAAGGHEHIIKILLAAGAEANGRDGDGSTPLGIAAVMGQLSSVKTLLAHGADPNLEIDLAGNNAVGVAALGNHKKMVALLEPLTDL